MLGTKGLYAVYRVFCYSVLSALFVHLGVTWSGFRYCFRSCSSPLQVWLLCYYCLLLALPVLLSPCLRGCGRAKQLALYVGVTPSMWVWNAIGAIWYSKSAVSTCLPKALPAPLLMTLIAAGFLLAAVLWFKGLLDARDCCRSVPGPFDDSLALIYQHLPPLPEAVFTEKTYSEGLKSEICTVCYEEFQVSAS